MRTVPLWFVLTPGASEGRAVEPASASARNQVVTRRVGNRPQARHVWGVGGPRTVRALLDRVGLGTGRGVG